MSVTIHIPQFLRHLTHNAEVVTVRGGTVGGCLTDFTEKFPGTRERLFDKNGKLLGYIDIFVNGQSSYPEELAKPVISGDELFILFLIVGG